MENHRGIIVQEHLPVLAHALEWVAAGIELSAVAILLLGLARFLLAFVAAEFGVPGGHRARAQNAGRILLARYILAALEVFIVADLMMTALTLSLRSLAFLGALVLIRSVVSWFLDHEIRSMERRAAGGGP
jgi:uncharacterized membrane protein